VYADTNVWQISHSHFLLITEPIRLTVKCFTLKKEATWTSETVGILQHYPEDPDLCHITG